MDELIRDTLAKMQCGQTLEIVDIPGSSEKERAEATTLLSAPILLPSRISP